MDKLNINNQWLKTTDRYVAFLDIMGFKDRVARDSHEDVLKMMNGICDTAKELNSEEYAYITTFSDSIILFSKDNSSESCEIFKICLIVIYQYAFDLFIPLKGAVAYGLTTVDIDKSLFLVNLL